MCRIIVLFKLLYCLQTESIQHKVINLIKTLSVPCCTNMAALFSNRSVVGKYLQGDSLLSAFNSKNQIDAMKLFTVLKKREERESSFYPARKAKKPRKARECKSKMLMKPKESNWWKLYCTADNPFSTAPKGSTYYTKFRRRFRLPFDEYARLLAEIRAEEWFPGYDTMKDAVGLPGAPLELKVLGALRVLGRHATFDDIEEATGISAETHRLFFIAFVKQGRHFLVPKHINMPQTQEELAECEREYALAGLPGCVLSMDGTHVVLEKLCVQSRHLNIGHKAKHTTRMFNIAVDHHRQIRTTGLGMPGRTNDQAGVKFHRDIVDAHDGTNKAFREFEFDLVDKDGKTHRHRGAWILVDGGYLKWRETICGYKMTANMDEIRWSKMMESMRKDVECTFGILKGRFRILKHGIR